MEMINHIGSENSSEIKNMLNNLYELFLKKFKETKKAWDYLLEFIALDQSAEMIFESKCNIGWLFDDKRFRDSVISVYDSNLLKSIYYDYLGEFYFEKIIKKSYNQTQQDKIKNQINTQCNEKKDSIKILDLDMGTGRNLMAIHKIAPNATFFGVTNDINLYRIGLTNSLLFGIKCFLLYADKMKHELGLNSERGISNWKRANKWSYGINELIQNLN